MKRFSNKVVLAAFAALAGSRAAAELVDRVAAVVNSEIITLSEVEKRAAPELALLTDATKDRAAQRAACGGHGSGSGCGGGEPQGAKRLRRQKAGGSAQEPGDDRGELEKRRAPKTAGTPEADPLEGGRQSEGQRRRRQVGVPKVAADGSGRCGGPRATHPDKAGCQRAARGSGKNAPKGAEDY